MGGGKGGKPISIIEKRQKKALEQQLKQQMKKAEQREKKTQVSLLVDESLINRAIKEVTGLNIITPYVLASKLGVNVSIAKRIMKELISRGMLTLVSKNRRVMVASVKTS
jgi:small subunit ribosomal protein S25e